MKKKVTFIYLSIFYLFWIFSPLILSGFAVEAHEYDKPYRTYYRNQIDEVPPSAFPDVMQSADTYCQTGEKYSRGIQEKDNWKYGP